jgi:uncharacterized membrane protein
MTLLIAGLLVFLGVHSIRVYADGWRSRTIARIGEGPWKGVYSLVAVAGIVMIAMGYGEARQVSATLYQPPFTMYHITALFVLLSLVFLAAAKVPGNQIKGAVGHPMLIGVKLWAAGHLIANGRVADVVLFGSFLVWAIVLFAVSRRLDRMQGVTYPAGTPSRTIIAMVIGAVVTAVFMAGAHEWLFGVRPLPPRV